MNDEPSIYDKRGIPILPGDTVKMFHFKEANGRNWYMYKYAVETQRTPSQKALMKFSHLNLRGETFWMLMDGKSHPDLEVVQGYGEDGVHFLDRKRICHE